jgi:FkbM family methyltransferase
MLTLFHRLQAGVMKAVIHKVRMRVPRSLRLIAASTPVLGSVLRGLDPLRDPDYIWKLPAPLEGVRFRVVDPSERQYVTAPYEPAVVAAMQAVVRPGMTCIDAGAHIGFMTLLMALKVGSDGCVFAFEPSDANCDRLRANLALNAIQNTTVVQAFVSSKSGVVSLARGPSSFEHRLSIQRDDLNAVDSVALEQYFVDKRVDFVKLDVEGADELAVEGMRGVLIRDHPTILIEDHGAPTDAAKGILLSLGYRFTEIDGAHTLAAPAS